VADELMSGKNTAEYMQNSGDFNTLDMMAFPDVVTPEMALY